MKKVASIDLSLFYSWCESADRWMLFIEDDNLWNTLELNRCGKSKYDLFIIEYCTFHIHNKKHTILHTHTHVSHIYNIIYIYTSISTVEYSIELNIISQVNLHLYINVNKEYDLFGIHWLWTNLNGYLIKFIYMNSCYAVQYNAIKYSKSECFLLFFFWSDAVCEHNQIEKWLKWWVNIYHNAWRNPTFCVFLSAYRSCDICLG